MGLTRALDAHDRCIRRNTAALTAADRPHPLAARLARHLLTHSPGSLIRKAGIMGKAQREDTGAASRSGLALGQIERWGAITAAAALMAYGARRSQASRAALAAAAVPLAFRGVAGRWPLGWRNGDTRNALGGRRGVHVVDSVRVERPVADVYRFWRRLENLPRFMDHLRSVTEIDDRRSHWVADGPAGLAVEWDAEIINEVEDDVIGWRSLRGADVVSAGSVNFEPIRGGKATQVTVKLQYAPPGGRIGAAVAKAFWRSPSQTVREDLRRLKQILEAGELVTAGNDVVHGGEA